MEATENKIQVYDYKKGVKDGIPVAMGYLPLAIAFGIFATKTGLGFWVAQVMHALVYSTSGQIAVLNSIAGQEIVIFACALLLFVVNFRYILLSISLAQKVGPSMNMFKRFLFGVFNTDEVFVLAMQKEGTLEAPYLFGLITLPYTIWTIGCTAGLFFTNIIPQVLDPALKFIAYGMFIAMIVPSAKKARPMLIAALIATGISVLLECTQVKNYIQPSWIIIICTIVTALICAWLFPVKNEEETKEVVEEIKVKEGGE